MKLISFRIRNFRSIKDTKCFLSNDITILAGKNESGKSSILDALSILNDWKNYSETDKPTHEFENNTPKIDFVFHLNEDEKHKLLGGLTDLHASKFPNEVCISLDPDKRSYYVHGSFIGGTKNLQPAISEEDKAELQNKAKAVTDLANKRENLSSWKFNIDFDWSNISSKKNEIDLALSELPRNENNQIVNSKVAELLNNLKTSIEKIENKTCDFKTIIYQLKPNIVLFKSFNDVIPPEIKFSELPNTTIGNNKYFIISDLAKLSGKDFTILQIPDRQKRKNLSEIISKTLTEKFLKHWNQNPIEIIIDADESVISFFIKDEGIAGHLKPEQRSDGLRWFISFYLKLEAQTNEHENIILIDEPGLSLHAKAQNDVLKELEKVSKNNQIVFTTHSPYLIDPDQLYRVRLVQRDEKNKTSILKGFHVGSDSDTLTPIITAIGLDVSREMFFSRGLNIVVEGISDYFYIRAMMEFLKRRSSYDIPSDTSIIPCVGEANIGLIASLLEGFGLKCKLVFDKKGSTKTQNKLKREGIFNDRIIEAGSHSDDSIEELFSKKDRKRFELDVKSKFDASRQFYEKIHSDKINSLSDETKNSFISLLNQIFDK